MKNRIILVAVLAFASTVIAQDAAESNQTAPDTKTVSEETRDTTSDRGEAFRARQVKLMEKALNELGITEEQRIKILELQQEHMEKMKANWQRLNEARNDLSRLQDESAPMEEIEAAIQRLADAQAEQLRIFAYNRREMESILGKEKNDLFMQNARQQFRRHGRRPGPDMPPIPGQEKGPNPPLPPPPPGASGNAVPPPPAE